MQDRGTGVETAVQDQELRASLVWALEGGTWGLSQPLGQRWLLPHARPPVKGAAGVNSETKPTGRARNAVPLHCERGQCVCSQGVSFEADLKRRRVPGELTMKSTPGFSYEWGGPPRICQG